MHYLRINPQGEILLVSVLPFFDTIAYEADLPADFFETMGLGKYRIVAAPGQPLTLQQVPNWVLPVTNLPV